MKSTIRPAQLMVLLCTAAAPGLLRGGSSLPGLLTGSLFLLIAPLLLCLPPRKRAFPHSLRTVGGVVLGLFFLWEGIRTAAELGRFAAGTEQAPATAPLMAAAVLLTGVWGVAQGIESTARAAGLWAAAGFILLIPVLAVLLPHTNTAQLYAHWRTVDTAPLQDGLHFFADFGGILALLWLLRVYVPDLRPRHGLILPAAVLVLGGICTAAATGMLGSWALIRTEPLYTAALSVPPEITFRPDSLYTVIRIAAHYCRAALFLFGAFLCLKPLPFRILRRVLTLTSIAGAILLSIWLTRRPEILAGWARLSRIPAVMLGLGLPLLAGRRECA